MRDFFISYNQADRHWAEWIAWELENAGYTAILQAWDFRPGSNFALEMHSAAQAAERTIAVLSPEYLESPFTMSEWAAAFAADPVAKQGKLLPVRVRQCDPKGLLSQIVYLDLVGLNEGKAKEVLLTGLQRERQRPTDRPAFPMERSQEITVQVPLGRSQSSIHLLHLSDLWIGFTTDRSLCDQVLRSVKGDILDQYYSDITLDAVLITGDIAFSAKREEYEEAKSLLSEFFKLLGINPATSCYLIPGNHDIDRSAIGPGDHFILKSLSTEEQIARVLSHGPTMELLSSRLAAFCDFTKTFLGKSRAWRRDRPWHVDVRRVAGRKAAFVQLNSVWSLDPHGEQVPMIGEYQVQEALTEAGECDLRIWLSHYPIASLRNEESARIHSLLARQDSLNLVFRGTRHDNNLSGMVNASADIGIMEFAAGPTFPGPVAPSCSVIKVIPESRGGEISVFQFDGRTQSWISDSNGHANEWRLSLPSGSGRVSSQKSKDRSAPLQSAASESQQGQRLDEVSGGQDQVRIQTVSEARLREVFTTRPVLILTTVDVELMAVLRSLKPLPKRRSILKGHIGQETYYAGRLGSTIVLVTMCGMGSQGRDSVILAAQQAISDFKPKAIIMVGIAFGKDPDTQRLGDVLVASQIVSYEQQRIGKKQVVHRGTISQTGPVLLNRFRQALDWSFSAPDGHEVHVYVGPLISGEKLIDQSDFKETLFDAFPQAIGGEMEGAGLYATASRFGVEWIVVKAVCDWADGSKSDNAQPLAAAAAASLVEHVLMEPTVLDAL